ncbi:uncharacterized protein LOC131617671 [Vicia villosa]|uniref:uncharacterized protein LOC131617671 n=1 Tax=Vicia villosa TaxID=3911 RepID=UPI00273BA748|nr:uncharacterized protein LOC131617671 [Vicia villosa]
MKIKSFIFAFFLCALIFISVVAIEPPKDEEKQTRAFEESKIILGINKNRRLRESRHHGRLRKRHSSEDLKFWINQGGVGGSFESGDFKGSINIGGIQDGVENIGLGGQGKIGNEIGVRGGGNNEFEGQGERKYEVSSIGEENKDLEENKKMKDLEGLKDSP